MTKGIKKYKRFDLLVNAKIRRELHEPDQKDATMPYIPQGATAAQRDAFAQRLCYQLSLKKSRTGLMELREAFARAGGFPDAHAAESSIKKDNAWRNPLSSLGLKPVIAQPAYRFLGIHPKNLFDWAAEAWKKQRALLALENFDLDATRALLAALWGHASWKDALHFERHAPLPKDAPHILMAATLGSLRTLATARGRGNFTGLHIALGQTPKGEWLGMGMQQAITHTVMINETRTERYTATRDWILHRINCLDGVCLFDASVDGQTGEEIMSMARSLGRNVHFIDLTKQAPSLPWLSLLSDYSLAHLLFNLLKHKKSDEKTEAPLLSWCILVARRLISERKTRGNSLVPYSIFNALQNPRTNKDWWAYDLGIKNDATFENVLRAFEALPKDFDKRRMALYPLLSNGNDPEQENFDFARSVTAVRLPFLLENPGDDDGQRRAALASSLYLSHLANGLGETCEEGVMPVEIIEDMPQKNPLDRMPFFMVHLDVPLSSLPDGYSVSCAQSRSMGSAMLFAGPSSILFINKNQECEALVVNINTKIFHGPEKNVVIYRGEIQEFVPMYTA